MKLRYRIFNIIIAFLLVFIVIGNVFAWFTTPSNPLGINGLSTGAYFAYGDGSEAKDGDNEGPYGITTPAHLFNLAWLQNTGKIPDGTYFELGDNIPMEPGYILPPIGNSAHPFNGTFNGNGKTITHLVISTNKNVLRGDIENYTEPFSNAVGMFGMTGTLSDIKNFILDNPTVEVAKVGDPGVDTNYSNVSEDSDPAVTGLAIGYVANKASSIGVIGGTLAVRRDGYKTVNSIIGAMSEEAMNNQNVTGGGSLGTGGSGNNYGASFDLNSFVERLKKIHKGKYGTEYNKQSTAPTPLENASYFLPDIYTANNDPVPASYEKVPFAVTSDSVYEGSKAREIVADNNIGYIIGNLNKTQVKSYKFVDEMIESTSGSNTSWVLPTTNKAPASRDTTPRWLYTNDNAIYNGGGYNSSDGFRPLTDKEFSELPDNIKSILFDDYTSKTENKPKDEYSNMTLRLQTAYYISGTTDELVERTYGWNYYGQISWMGKTYMKGFRDVNGNAVDEDGTILNSNYSNYTGGVFLPNDCIWFKPAKAGKIRFILYAEDDATNFQLIKAIRTPVTNTSENPFVSPKTGTIDYTGIQMQVVFAHSIGTPYCLMYFEHTITQEEIDAKNVEYFVTGYNDKGKGAYFVYLDIGASGNDQEEPDTGIYDSTKTVSSIDFIYKGVTITDGTIGNNIPAGSFVKGGESYKETGTMISFGGNGALVYFYYRDENGVTFSVGYYGNNEPTASVDGKHKPISGLDDINITTKNYEPKDWIPT